MYCKSLNTYTRRNSLCSDPSFVVHLVWLCDARYIVTLLIITTKLILLGVTANLDVLLNKIGDEKISVRRRVRHLNSLAKVCRSDMHMLTFILVFDSNDHF